MSGHTPGPWTIHPYSDVSTGTVAASEDRPSFDYRDVTIGAGPTIVASVPSHTLPVQFSGYPTVTNREEQDANVRLILAAPRMLAALYEVAHHADDECGFMVDVRAALAAVEGR